MAVYLKETAPVDVTVVGESGTADTQEMLSLINSRFSPETTLAVKTPGEAGEHRQLESKATAYVCKNFSCLPPVTDLRELALLLDR